MPEAAAAQPEDKTEAEYLRTMHAHVHRRWADNFLRLSAEKLPANNPLNQPKLTAEVDLVVTADGQLLSAKVVRGSGFGGFDDAAIEVLRDAVPFPLPPDRASARMTTSCTCAGCLPVTSAAARG